MSIAISSATSSAPVDQPESPRTSETKAKAPTTPAADTATISSAALNAAKAAIQEASETPAQTAKEANAGDHQAQRLLAREQAAKQ